MSLIAIIRSFKWSQKILGFVVEDAATSHGNMCRKLGELLGTPNVKSRTISSQASDGGRFNDYSARKYTQASGSAEHP